MGSRRSGSGWFYVCAGIMGLSWLASFISFVKLHNEIPLRFDNSERFGQNTKSLHISAEKDVKMTKSSIISNDDLQNLIESTQRKRFTKGLTRWEVYEGLDVIGADIESIADKDMAIYSCFTNPSCKGFVWSEAQGQGYLKSDTKRREKRKSDLKLSLFVRGYEEMPGFEVKNSEQTIGSQRKVQSIDDAKQVCEGMPQCHGFVILATSAGRSHSLQAKFYTEGALRSKSKSTEHLTIIYQRSDTSLVSNKVSKAEVLGLNSNGIPKDISRDPPIIVGGTDGSGTRAVVTMLSNLNVLMVKDDACTFDVHAGEMGGWPPVVQTVLKHSHGADYSVESIPEPDRRYIRQNVRKFADKMIKEAKRFSEVRRHERWGFKAPIAQMLLPFLKEVFPKFSFVHVIRDGRDIPFSKNQSPVDKFFNQMYSNDQSALRLPKKLKAIRMWSDANVQVRSYMKREFESTYLPVPIETTVEETSLLQLGSKANEMLQLGYQHADMCCRLRGYIRFLRGKDFFHGVKSRYGKWKKLTETDLTLRSNLNNHGRRGLSEFGYLKEPKERRISWGLDDSVDVCADVPIGDAGKCNFEFPSKCVESPDIR
mmetsp:Transcript_15997/g.24105  ORF Transcript_15997/g.24105 Transcript_15997/m.24105 type:complete len:595 (-) Transcript_15997:125-1909(-)